MLVLESWREEVSRGRGPWPREVGEWSGLRVGGVGLGVGVERGSRVAGFLGATLRGCCGFGFSGLNVTFFLEFGDEFLDDIDF